MKTVRTCHPNEENPVNEATREDAERATLDQRISVRKMVEASEAGIRADIKAREESDDRRGNDFRKRIDAAQAEVDAARGVRDALVDEFHRFAGDSPTWRGMTFIPDEA